MSKLNHKKEIDLTKYNNLELTMLMFDLFKELTKREKVSEKVLDELNQKTFDYTHEVELGDIESNKDKVEMFDKMKKHFALRRIAKKENLVSEDIISALNIDYNKIVCTMGSLIKKKQEYFKISDGEEQISQREWNKFYKECIEIYL